ncbi:alpha/beta fold hydrolase [Caballeronia ptereochthonis]|uniref:Alpha/beta hydrolase fold protein n=1 Tax=Caballeronia ptereochthonis TaxID=1777144 RepID=A0A157ZF04_9BURK|nr:alpha/beta hydrolase [Caballeronia ptereochthonis]SAK44114.1 Alpha/beta hydrolase fold protein [Caballeronia ptereochthonis]
MKRGARLPGTPDPMHIWSGADGLRIAGDSWGDPSDPLVVLLHGGGQTRHAWGGTGELLGTSGYHAVAFDARGHGDSDWSPEGDYSQDAFVRDLRCVLDALGATCPTLIGASLGGGTSLVSVGEEHVEANALVLVDIVPSTEAAGVARIRTFMGQKPDGFASLEEVADAISAYQPQRRRPDNLDGLAKNVRLSDDGVYRWHWDPRFLAYPRDLGERRRRLSASARKLAVPTLLVRGGSSDVVSEEGVREFLDLCPQAEYVNVAQAGHMVAGDRNDIFGHATIDFLARHVPA